MSNEQKKITLPVLTPRPQLPVHDENATSPDAISRRSMLKVIGASAILATGAAGCERKPKRRIISRSSAPEFQTPGKSIHYASTWTEGQVPYGMLIKTVDGRPIKIEGLPGHPLNNGTSSAQMQASTLGLYDPERLQKPLGVAALPDADTKILAVLSKGQKPVVVMTRALLGPSERAMLAEFLRAIPNGRGKHFVYEPINDAPRRAAWNKLYGGDGELQVAYGKARVVLSLDADFMGNDGAALHNIYEFSKGRRPVGEQATMNRLHVIESALTVTGSNADHRLAMSPEVLPDLLTALLGWVRSRGRDATSMQNFARRHHADFRLLAAVGVDLLATKKGAAVVVAGAHLPEEVHAAVALLNDELGATDTLLTWNPNPATLPVTEPAEIKRTLQAGGGVDALIMLGVNPVYDFPGGGFAALLKNAGLSVAHGLQADETVTAATIGLPSTHNLESWGDSFVAPGVSGLCQPVIRPLYNAARQEAESLLVWTKALSPQNKKLAACKDWHDYVYRRWTTSIIAKPAEGVGAGLPTGWATKAAWYEALQVGFYGRRNSAKPPALNRVAAQKIWQKATNELHSAPEHPQGATLFILPHHAVHDGRFAGNAWLQELPDPINKLTWENAASISPAMAKKLGGGHELASGEVLQLTLAGKRISLPLIVQTNMAENVIVVTLGHGRQKGGAVATAEGTNVAVLLGLRGERIRYGVAVRKTGRRITLARTQESFSMTDELMENAPTAIKEVMRETNFKRPHALVGTLDEYREAMRKHDGPKDAGSDRRSDFVKHKYGHLPPEVDIYPPMQEALLSKEKWAMTVDLSTCVGCNACVVACQAENNIPVVGKKEVAKGREMHWLRIDRYEDKDGSSHNQPMLCQQCDFAPCENVCPVNATSHSPDGLNEMVYNRCVGTRYCANNCPYKVRRFNFLEYTGKQLAGKNQAQQLVFNPQVTVRSRGVMEKCTFCVQRIHAGTFNAKNKDRPVRDGEIKTACQQSCPAGAITFGNIKDRLSQVARQANDPRAYHVLEELTIKPNVNYLLKIKNPVPGAVPDAPQKSSQSEGHHG